MPLPYDLTDRKSIAEMLEESPALRDLSNIRYTDILRIVNEKRDALTRGRYSNDNLKFAIVQAYLTGFVDAVQTGNANDDNLN